MENKQRERDITRVSVVGIVSNAMLGGVKLVVGVLIHSIAIISDAVNNLTDTASSIITIIGTHLAGRRPDAKHPFGYGRVEYLTSLVIGLTVLFTGVELCRSSIHSIIHPDHTHFDWLAVIILAATVVVKLLLGAYTYKAGKRLDSTALVASGLDARSDAVSTGAAMVAALLYIWKGISIDAWVGALISLYIVRTGFVILKDTVSKLVGEAASKDLAKEIYSRLRQVDVVVGAYDLILNNYGPDYYVGSVHVEVRHDITAEDFCRAIDPVQKQIYHDLRTMLTVGIYAVDKTAPENTKAIEAIDDFCKNEPACSGYHGLFVDDKTHRVYCDITVDFSCDHEKAAQALTQKLQEAMPGYTPEVTVDSPFE